MYVCMYVCMFVCIYDLLSLNDDSSFEKHYKNIYPTELELKKENNSNSLKMENSILNNLTNKITLASTLYGCHFTAPVFLAKCSKGALEQSFLEFLE